MSERIIVRIPASLKARLERIAKRRGSKIGTVAREAIEKGLGRVK